jgi:phenylalanyl-tRNA synthetase beta chain
MFLPRDEKEQRHLGILLWGNAVSTPHWQAGEKRRLDLFDLKGAIESLALPAILFRRGEQPDLALAAQICSSERAIGFAGQLREGKIEAPGAVFVAELDVDLALRGAEAQKTFREIEKFPAVTRDIAMIVPEKVSHNEILRVIQEPKEPLLERVELFDLFAGESAAGLGAERKSLAYRLTYRDRSRTLTSEEVSAVHAKIRERLQRDLGAELRE